MLPRARAQAELGGRVGVPGVGRDAGTTAIPGHVARLRVLALGTTEGFKLLKLNRHIRVVAVALQYPTAKIIALEFDVLQRH